MYNNLTINNKISVGESIIIINPFPPVILLIIEYDTYNYFPSPTFRHLTETSESSQTISY